MNDWASAAYGSGANPTVMSTPLAQPDGFIEPVDGAVGLLFDLTPKYVGKTGGEFIAPIAAPDPNAIKIYTAQDLYNVRNNLNGSYVLMKNIDLSSFNDGEWVPIGRDYISPFTGTFDGQGFVISNLTITGGQQYSGLFGCVTDATIKNIGLEKTNINIYIFSGTQDITGGICGESRGNTIINNCYNIGNIYDYSQASIIGGICGYNFANIKNCYNAGNISASSHQSFVAMSGGISGRNVATIENCYNTGNITSESPTVASVGGIAGNTSGGIIKICYNEGNIYASGSSPSNAISAGGISGSVSDGSSISDCYNVGVVFSYTSAGNAYSGGICGFDEYGNIGGNIINNCYSIGIISSNDYVGGILGGDYTISAISITNGYWNVDSKQIINDSELTNENKNGVGRGKYTTTSLTSEQMRNRVNFIGFDFDTVWTIHPFKNNGYPILRAFDYPIDDMDIVVSLPSLEYIIGQKETLSVPFDKLPVRIKNNPGIAAFQMNITYDPAVLTPVKVESGGVWNAGITSNLTQSGKIVIGGASISPKFGDGDIAVIEFAVNNAAADGVYPVGVDVTVFRTLNDQNNQIDIPFTSANGNVKISSVMRGDVYEDKRIDMSDVLEVKLYLAELKDLTLRQLVTAKVTVDNPRIVPPASPGDVNLKDAQELELIAVGLVSPPPPWGIASPLGRAALPVQPDMAEFSVPAPAGTVTTAALTMGSASGNQGDTVTVPINISGGSGFSALEFKIEYDNTKLTPVSVAKGSIWSDDLIVNLNGGGGEYIKIVGVTSANSNGSGTIAYVTFKIKDNAASGVSAVNLVVEGLLYLDSAYNSKELPHTIENGKIAIGMPVTYTVTFNLNGGTRTGGGEVTQIVTSGASAVAPNVTRSGYTLTWDKDFTNVTSDITVTAQWTANSTFKVTGKVISVTGDTRPATVTLTQNGNTISTQTNQNGEYVFSNVAAGSYTLVITKVSYLKYTKTSLAVSNQNISYKDVTLIPGDIDGDGYVSYNDFLIFLENYNKQGANIANKAADINGDGYVDYNDFLTFLSGYGKAAVVE